jgi:hypothetical protein
MKGVIDAWPSLGILSDSGGWTPPVSLEAVSQDVKQAS